MSAVTTVLSFFAHVTIYACLIMKFSPFLLWGLLSAYASSFTCTGDLKCILIRTEKGHRVSLEELLST
jgi:predicted RND superfamily exporter protein